MDDLSSFDPNGNAGIPPLRYTPGTPFGYSDNGQGAHIFDGWTPEDWSLPSAGINAMMPGPVTSTGIPSIAENNVLPMESSSFMPSFSPDVMGGSMPGGMGDLNAAPRKSIFGVPMMALGAGLGIIANAMNPKDRPGQGSIDAFESMKRQGLAEKELGLRERHLGVQEKMLEGNLALKNATLEMNQTYKNILSDTNQQRLQKMLDEDTRKKAEGDALGRLVKAKPGTPEFETAKVDYLKSLTNPDKIPKGLSDVLFGTEKPKDAEASKREAFETLYPRWKGQVGSPEYAEAFQGFLKPTKEGKAPGSLAEFEEAYKNKGGDINKIKGTPAYEKAWQEWKKSTITPAAQVHNYYAFSNAAQTEKGRQSAQPQLTQDALEVEGAKYATTGVMPPLGMNNPVMRTKIVNAGAQYLKNQGLDPSSVPALQAEFKGAKDTYVNMKKSTENFGAFEKAMIKNTEYALEVSKGFPRTQMPPINKVLNAIRTGTGDPKVVEFGTAIYAAAMEFEKIRTAGTNITSAELSIGAQKKAEEVLSKASTHQQLQAAVKAMKTDAKNVMGSRRGALDSLDKEMKALSGSMGKPSPAEKKADPLGIR